MAATSPFLITTDKRFVVLKGNRNGYIQLATSNEITSYQGLTPDLMQVALSWCQILEKNGAKRVYWVTLSEAVRHLHIHLYPRWLDEEAKGIELFESRDNLCQPDWTEPIHQVLEEWANNYDVAIIN